MPRSQGHPGVTLALTPTMGGHLGSSPGDPFLPVFLTSCSQRPCEALEPVLHLSQVSIRSGLTGSLTLLSAPLSTGMCHVT